jgi:hypothetical protein
MNQEARMKSRNGRKREEEKEKLSSGCRIVKPLV